MRFLRSVLDNMKIARIRRKANCSKAEAKKRIKIAANAGIDEKSLIKSGLYRMPANKLRLYLKRRLPRDYAILLSEKEGGGTNTAPICN